MLNKKNSLITALIIFICILLYLAYRSCVIPTHVANRTLCRNQLIALHEYLRIYDSKFDGLSEDRCDNINWGECLIQQDVNWEDMGRSTPYLPLTYDLLDCPSNETRFKNEYWWVKKDLYQKKRSQTKREKRGFIPVAGDAPSNHDAIVNVLLSNGTVDEVEKGDTSDDLWRSAYGDNGILRPPKRSNSD